MRQGTILGSQIGRWIILAALVVVLGALLLTIRPAGAQEAPASLATAKRVHYYSENHTTLVVHPYSVTDPERRKIFWTLSGTDAASFTIEGGTLRFKSQPNYEVPTDRRAYTDANTNDMFDPGETVLEDPSDNTYRVTVRASAGGEGGEPGTEADIPPDDHDGNDLDVLDVTVHVTNAEETGRVLISSLQPQVGTTLTATVSDPDGVTVVGSWQWASSDSMNGEFADIPELSDANTYQPTDDYLGKYLRVKARYRDNASLVDTDIRIVMAVSSHTVRKDVVSSNEPPEFPDQKTLLGGSLIVRNNTERFIRENSPAGTNVGAPVTAFDDNTEIEVLTYSLIGTHKGSFNIHPVTGQITVSAAAKLNAEAGTGQPGDAATPYRVTVVATDGDGERKTIDVVIRVVGYNEPPSIRSGAREMTHWEEDRTDRSATTIDTDLDSSVLVYSGTPPTPTGTVDFAYYQDAIYTATDPDAADRVSGMIADDPDNSTVMWSLAGDDAEKFFIYTNVVTNVGTPTTDRTISGVDVVDGNPVTVSISIANFDDFDDIKDHLEKTGISARLAFKAGPDWEVKGDKNNDNIYEVTIVATDSVGNTAESPVTVKVKNSTDDNKPGEVTILNRQPEIKARLEAKLEDSDKPTGSTVQWQWYRQADPGADPVADPRTRCADYDPHGGDAPPSMAVRYFIDTDAADITWKAIPGAMGSGVNAHYTPGYDARVGGRQLGPEDGGDYAVNINEQWRGGDIDVDITVEPQTASAREFTTYVWTNAKCLRVAFMYEDGVDRTHAGQDNLDTAAVDETMEGAFMGSEFPVKRPDDRNDAPVFTIDDSTDGGEVVSRYTAERKENVEPYSDADPVNTADGATRRINEAFPARDPMEGEDDNTDNPNDDGTLANADSAGPGPGPDILTYSLSGPDAKYFKITGTAITGTAITDTAEKAARLAAEYNATETDDTGGILSFKSKEDLKKLGLPDLDFETKRVFTVIITVADPSGDEKTSATVTVDLTDYNEMPKWVKDTSPTRVVYPENGTDALAKYIAKDPETTVNYGLVKVPDATVMPAITADDVADHALFKIDPLTGILSFKKSPNYEKPGDGEPTDAVVTNTRDNMYKVTVSATVADNPALIAGPHVITRMVTVVVNDVNEEPVFAESTDTLEITENSDDPEKEPPSAHGYLYLLNRGVGKPAANLPAAPNLDVGIPVAAADDDSTATFPVGGYTDATTPTRDARDRIDGLTYTLSGTDAGYFNIVPATGQILTKVKLDYEAKNEYKVMVTATDPDGESDSIDMTIKVTNLDEKPVPKILTISGDATPTYEENGTDDLGEYTVAASGGASANPNWTLEGTDAGNFRLTGSGNSRMLKFSSPPDYETPMGGADNDSNTYMVTLKVTDSSDSTVMDPHEVTVTVTDDPELGALSGSTSVSVNEGDTDLGTYELTAIEDGPRVTWSKGGVDADQFMLEGTGMSRMLKFSSAPDYESPMGGADNDSNTYMVTVMAKAGGEMKMVEVTVMVDDVDELGSLGGPTSASVMEGATDALGTYTLTGTAAATADWSLDGADMSDFMLEGTGMSRMLNFRSAPDYESPMGGANNDSNTYMVTVMAEAGGEMEMVEVTITVDNVEEAGTVTLNPTRPSVGTPITASLADSDIVEGTVSWQWASADAMGGDFEDITGATSATYTPVEADAGMFLMATATYTDVFGNDSAYMVSSAAVTQLAVNGADAVDHPENTTNVNATYTASGASGTVAWTVSGDDAGAFTISGGMLTFNTAPNFEAAADANTDNMYNVTVVATADGNMDTHDLTVTVTNEDEAGTVTGLPTSAMVGAELTADLSDDDGATNITWQWARAGTDIDGATSASYTVAEEDAGMSLEVTATYDDVHAIGKMVSGTVMISADVVDSYDTNGIPGIQSSELFDAIEAFVAEEIGQSALFDVIEAFVAGG